MATNPEARIPARASTRAFFMSSSFSIVLRLQGRIPPSRLEIKGRNPYNGAFPVQLYDVSTGDIHDHRHGAGAPRKRFAPSSPGSRRWGTPRTRFSGRNAPSSARSGTSAARTSSRGSSRSRGGAGRPDPQAVQARSREVKPERTVIRIAPGVTVGDRQLLVIAGPAPSRAKRR